MNKLQNVNKNLNKTVKAQREQMEQYQDSNKQWQEDFEGKHFDSLQGLMESNKIMQDMVEKSDRRNVELLQKVNQRNEENDRSDFLKNAKLLFAGMIGGFAVNEVGGKLHPDTNGEENQKMNRQINIKQETILSKQDLMMNNQNAMMEQLQRKPAMIDNTTQYESRQNVMNENIARDNIAKQQRVEPTVESREVRL